MAILQIAVVQQNRRNDLVSRFREEFPANEVTQTVNGGGTRKELRDEGTGVSFFRLHANAVVFAAAPIEHNPTFSRLSPPVPFGQRAYFTSRCWQAKT